MQLRGYLRRIGVSGNRTATLETLGELLRAHNHNIPFENLDVQFEKPLSISIEEAYKKIVLRNRGGWCYEQNGVFGWALSRIGFGVQRIAASVMREDRGSLSHANHLSLIATLPDDGSRWLVDAGFGGSLLQPIPLQDGKYNHAPFELGLRQLDDGFWQFWEDFGEGEFSFDFEDRPADEHAMSDRCHYLQTDEESGFVQNFVCQIRHPDAHLALRGRVLFKTSREGRTKRTLQTADELVATLKDEFNLDVPEAASLWDRICERHEQFIAAS